jgi:hypothetical protein
MQGHDANPLSAQQAPQAGYHAAHQVDPRYRTGQLAATDLTEAPTGEVAHEAAIDQRVHSRCLAGEQRIHHLRRDAVLASAGFDDKRRAARQPPAGLVRHSVRSFER